MSLATACIESVAAHSVVTKDRLANLAALARQTGHLRGDVVECGVAAGGSAAVLAWTIKESNRDLWLYDSFQGLPHPTGKDGRKAEQHFGANRCPKERVLEALEKVEFPRYRTRIVEGWFHDTLRQEVGPSEIAFLHIDSDWYDSVRDCLESFYERVVLGGIVVLDDYGYWEGCRMALYEFCALRQISPRLERFNDQAWWVK